MLKLGQSGEMRRLALVEDSPLRKIDPRVKLAMSLGASLAVMLPLNRLLLFMGFYLLLLFWARLLPEAGRQVWRMKVILILLFGLDTWLVSVDLAVIVTLRLALLAGVFSLLFATTTSSEFSLALEGLRLPYRYAFSLSLAFQSLALLDEEWRLIREAQQARGALPEGMWVHKWLRQVGDLVALTVPAVVLTTRRAWTVTEAAYARGFDSPRRRAYRQLKLLAYDWLALLLTIIVTLAFYWRWT